MIPIVKDAEVGKEPSVNVEVSFYSQYSLCKLLQSQVIPCYHGEVEALS